jgi:hypothetical protein
MHHYYIVGKTSTIVAAAKRMYDSPGAYSTMALELNASDARGIDVRFLLVQRRRRTPQWRLCISSFSLTGLRACFHTQTQRWFEMKLKSLLELDSSLPRASSSLYW